MDFYWKTGSARSEDLDWSGLLAGSVSLRGQQHNCGPHRRGAPATSDHTLPNLTESAHFGCCSQSLLPTSTCYYPTMAELIVSSALLLQSQPRNVVYRAIFCFQAPLWGVLWTISVDTCNRSCFQQPKKKKIPAKVPNFFPFSYSTLNFRQFIQRIFSLHFFIFKICYTEIWKKLKRLCTMLL